MKYTIGNKLQACAVFSLTTEWCYVVIMHNMLQEQNLSLTLSTLINNTIVCMLWVVQSVVMSYSLTYVFIVFNTHVIFNLTKY